MRPALQQNFPRFPIPNLRRIDNPRPILHRNCDPIDQHKNRRPKINFEQRLRRRKFVNRPVLIEPIEPPLAQIAQPLPQRVRQTARGLFCNLRHRLARLPPGFPRLRRLSARLRRSRRHRLHRKQRMQPRPLAQRKDLRRNLIHRVALHNPVAHDAMHHPASRPQQPHVVVNLRRRRYRRPRIPRRVLLPNRNRRRQPVNQIHIRLLDPLQKLPRIRRQRLDIPPLPFRIDRVEGEARLARPRDAGNDGQLPVGDRTVDVFQVVSPRAADDNLVAQWSVPGGKRKSLPS